MTTTTSRFGASILGSTVLLTGAVLPAQVSAVPTFFGPIPYLAETDIPAGLYASGLPDGLENFEDLSLDFGITASAGNPIGPGAITDSVDGDSGLIDGSGISGSSFFSGFGAGGITFSFPTPVEAAGIVWTDGAGTTTFEAFGLGGISLGTIGPVDIATAGFAGQTDEDRFFGVQDLDGIESIRLSNTSGGIEVDHLQFGGANVSPPPPPPPSPVPEPATLALVALGVAGVGINRRRRRVQVTC